jgi:hypothetical protein
MPFSKSYFFHFLVIILLFTSCSTAKMMEKSVFSHYGEMPVQKDNSQTQYIKVETELTRGSHPKIMSTSTKKKTKILFLLLYWHEHHILETRLNQQIPVNQFTNSIYQFARNSKFSEKLKNGVLTLEIVNVPATYSFHFESYGALLLITWDKIYLAPGGENLLVNYSFVKDGQTAKTGKVEIKDPNSLYNFGYFQSLKAATDDYLTAYDNFYKNAGKMVLEKIIAEL